MEQPQSADGPGTIPAYETLEVRLAGQVAQVALNRPHKANAMNRPFWREIREAMQWADATPAVRAVVLSANGLHFTAGIDLEMLQGLQQEYAHLGEGRRQERTRRLILELQEAFTAVERCRKPVLAAVHGACMGGGIDLISACDIRYASADARFAIKEIEIGLTADVGTLQRLPHLIPDGVMRELAYTGREVDAEEARAIGLVNRVLPDRDALLREAGDVAAQIASRSPLAVRGTKEMILYTRDHTVADGLEHVATWNAGMLSPEDVSEAIRARAEKRTPRFDD